MSTNFPVSKDTWVRKINRNLAIGEVGDDLDQADFNDWADWLEKLQDTLGVNFIQGYASLKLKLASMIVGQTGDRICLGIHHINYTTETANQMTWQDVEYNFFLDTLYYALLGCNIRYRLEGQVRPTVAQGGVTMRLYDVTSDVAVPNSEVTKQGQNNRLYRITTPDLELTNGNEYKIQIKLPDTDKWGDLMRARIAVYGVRQ